jgi:PAS domain S-box-containing protein
MTGYSREELLGSHCSLVVGDDVSASAANLSRVLAAVAGDEHATLEADLLRADGERLPAESRFTPLPSDDGEYRGTVGVVRDISDRKERERELERYETIVETVGDGIYALDPDDRIVFVNEAFCALTGYDREELIGRHPTLINSREVNEAANDLQDEMLSTARDVSVIEFDVRTSGGETVPVESRISPYEYDDGQYGRCGVVRDIADRKARELDLERYKTIVETVGDAIYVVDEDQRFTMVNQTAVELSGYPRERIIGTHVGNFIGERAAADARRLAEELSIDEHEVAVSEFSLSTAGGGEVPIEVRFTRLPTDDGSDERVGVARDISERKEHERELRARVSQQEVVTRLSHRALNERDLDGLMDEVVRSVADTLGMDYCKVLELHSDRDELALRAGVGWREGIVGSATVATIENSQAGYTLLSDEPVVVEDLAAETRFSGPDLLLDHGVKSGMSVIIGPQDAPWGILGTHDTSARGFSENDVNFLQSVANILAAAIERRIRERDLEESERRYRTLAENFPNGGVALFDEKLRYQLLAGTIFEELGVARDQLVELTLGDLSSDAETSEKITRYGRAALEGETSRYEFEWNDRSFRAWVVPVTDEGGDVFAGMIMSQEITDLRRRERELEQQRERLSALNQLNAVVREITDAVIEQSTREEIERTVVEALADSDSYEFAWIGGVDPSTDTIRLRTEAGVEGYLDDLTLSADPDHPLGNGPTAKAIRTQQLQITSDVQEDFEVEQWREHARTYGFRSSAAIPIVHDATMYGVLCVYARRPNAFTEEVRSVIGQLGEVVGHAIAAIDRKHALTSDQVVELDFQLENVFASLDISTATADRITLDQAVPSGDGDYLVYGTVAKEDMAVLNAIVDRLPHWRSVRSVGEEFDRTKFEVRLTEPPVLTAVASRGGYVKEAWIKDGDYHMTIQLPPSVDARKFTEVVKEAYPIAELRAQRQVNRVDEGSTRVLAAFEDDLTERQRSALEAAYFAGFFEWPRESSGEEVADSLGVSPPTFSQHLRTAENKIFGALFAPTSA